VQALLRAVDRTTSKGLRDYAMLLLVATYGLRAGEVAALRLDDIAWRAREIRMPRPKVGTSISLPLTDEVASALLDYLRDGRPASVERAVFLRVRAPAGPVLASVVSNVFDVWASRAGIVLPAGRAGPYCMRHAVAMQLLRQGAALKSIGDLLGHRSVESTSVYLRLHLDDLRGVALPLPSPATAGVHP
jgi:integrase